MREGIRKYYQQAGWDESGIPKSEILEKLNTLIKP